MKIIKITSTILPALAVAMGTTFAASVQIPGAHNTSAEWARISPVLGGIKGRITAPMTGSATNTGVQNSRLSAGPYTGNGINSIVTGGSAVDSVANNWSHVYYFGNNYLWGTNPDNNDGTLTLGSLVIAPAAGAAGAGSASGDNYEVIQNIREGQLESRMQSKDINGDNAMIHIIAWTPDCDGYGKDGAYNYDDDLRQFRVFEIENAGAAPVNLSASIASPSVAMGTAQGSRDYAISYPFGSGCDAATGEIWFTRETNQGRDTPSPYGYSARAAVVARVAGTKFTSVTSASSEGTARGEFQVPAGGKVQLYLYTRTTNSGERDDPTPRGNMREPFRSVPENLSMARAELSAKLARFDLGKVRQAHHDWWKDYWLQSFVYFDDATIMRFYYGAQYALGVNQRADQQHPNSMFGLLITRDSPGWGGRYFCNYNHQAQYYGAGSSNHPGAIRPFANVITWKMPQQMNVQTRSVGFKGVGHQRSLWPVDYYRDQPALIDIAPYKTIQNTPSDQKSNGAFIALPMMWVYEYTMDEDYLKNVLYPYVYESMEFYMDYAVRYYRDQATAAKYESGPPVRFAKPWRENYMPAEYDPKSYYLDEWRFSVADVASSTAPHYEDWSDKWKFKEGQDYIYMIDNSAVHESDHHDLSPGLDIGGAERLARFLLDHGRKAGASPAKIAQWQDFLDNLVAYPQRTFSNADITSNLINYPSADDNGGVFAADRARLFAMPEITVMASAYAISPYCARGQYVIEPFDQPVELEPVFPFESRTIMQDPKQVQKALNTLLYMAPFASSSRSYRQQIWFNPDSRVSGGNTPWTRQTYVKSFNSGHNGLCKVFPIAARLGWPAADLIAKFKQAEPMTDGNFRDSNLLPTIGGGGLEGIGATEFVNSMFLQSDLKWDNAANNYISYIKVFPNWTGADAHFIRLLAKGATEVTSEMKGGAIESIGLNSKAGTPISLKNPWGGATSILITDSRGATVPSTCKDGCVVFTPAAGESYLVRPK